MTDTKQKIEKPDETPAVAPVAPVEVAPSQVASPDPAKPPQIEPPPVVEPPVGKVNPEAPLRLPAGWYRLHLKDSTKGPRRMKVQVGKGAFALFNASQKDAEAEDFPTKVVMLTEIQANDYNDHPAFEIRKAAAPEPKGLGKQMVSRTIGAKKAETAVAGQEGSK